ncbi:MAG: NFACT family protein [Evtepia gabavorous]
MPMDALCLSAVCREVEPAVLGGRIDKIYQPSRDEILLQIRGRAGSCRLLLSANPSRPRLQLTDLPRENPAEPPCSACCCGNIWRGKIWPSASPDGASGGAGCRGRQ